MFHSLGHMWKIPFHRMILFWILVAKEVLKNLNKVSWNDSGIEVIWPSTEGQDQLELSKPAKVAWTQHGRKSEANEVLPEVDLYDQTFEHQFQNELPPSIAVEVFSDDIWVIHKRESYSNPI